MSLALVIEHPALTRRRKIAALQEELADAEELARDLETGRRPWSDWYDGPPFLGAQQDAALEAWQFADDLRKQLAALEGNDSTRIGGDCA